MKRGAQPAYSMLWVFLLGIFVCLGCDGAMTPTGDTMVPLKSLKSLAHSSDSVASRDVKREAAGVAVAVVYSTNNHGEIDPCG